MDFSGARDAGRKIWIARARAGTGTLKVVSCQSVSDLFRAAGREPALQVLCSFIKSSSNAAFGLDFPFGLPKSLVPDVLVKGKRWEDFIRSFNYAGPEEFRNTCKTKAQGRELRRTTDRESKTPFSPYNRRLYRQTYYGIREVLRPLVHDKAAYVLPMQRPRKGSGRPLVLEVCPASTLKALGLYRPYKGRGAERRRMRGEIVSHLTERGVSLEGSLKTVVDDPGGDALDSVIAAYAVFSAIKERRLVATTRSDSAIEGYVYV